MYIIHFTLNAVSHKCFNYKQNSTCYIVPIFIISSRNLRVQKQTFPRFFIARIHEIDANESKWNKKKEGAKVKKKKEIVQSLSSYRIFSRPRPRWHFFPWARVSARMERTEIYASSGAIVNRRNLFASRNWPEEYNIDTVGYLRRGW